MLKRREASKTSLLTDLVSITYCAAVLGSTLCASVLLIENGAPYRKAAAKIAVLPASFQQTTVLMPLKGQALERRPKGRP